MSVLKKVPGANLNDAVDKAKKAIILKVTLYVGIPALLLALILCIPLLIMMMMSDSSDFSNVNPSDLLYEEVPVEYIPIYERAASEYGIPWPLLVAIHKIETQFSTLDNMVSSVGAIGHFQFMECTWLGWSYPSCGGVGDLPDWEMPQVKNPELIAKYGGYGVDGNGDGYADPYDLEDAAFAAAKMLAANGAREGDIHGAIYAYNHASWYVVEVFSTFQSYIDGDLIIRQSDLAYPVLKLNVTSHYGTRTDPINGEVSHHLGIDFGGVIGDPVYASLEGEVIFAGPSGTYGNYLMIQHSDGLSTAYAHLNDIYVNVGDVVSEGEIVAEIGTTGRSTGPHLHFELRRNGQVIDPAPYLGLVDKEE